MVQHIAPDADGRGLPRVLIVDGHPFSREGLETLLAAHGADVSAVSSGTEALSALSAGGRVEMVIVDVRARDASLEALLEALERGEGGRDLAVLLLVPVAAEAAFVVPRRALRVKKPARARELLRAAQRHRRDVGR